MEIKQSFGWKCSAWARFWIERLAGTVQIQQSSCLCLIYSLLYILYVCFWSKKYFFICLFYHPFTLSPMGIRICGSYGGGSKAPLDIKEVFTFDPMWCALDKLLTDTLLALSSLNPHQAGVSESLICYIGHSFVLKTSINISNSSRDTRAD